MASYKAGKRRAATLDRFATHRRFACEEAAKLTRKTGSFGAALALFIVWDMANGKTGTVQRLSVSRLAQCMGGTRNAARAALAALVEAELIEKVAEFEYRVRHEERPAEGG